MNTEKLLNDFVKYKMNIEGKSEKTLQFYTTDLRAFWEFSKIKTVEDVYSTKAQQVRDWLEELSKHSNPTTRNRKLAGIKSFYNYLIDVKDIDVDYKIIRIPMAKKEKTVKYCPTYDEMQQMLVTATNQRTKAIIAVLMSTGVRFSELLQITCQDINNGYAIIVGKGNKERQIWFGEQCRHICLQFINKKRKYIVEKYNVQSDLLFLSDEGNLVKEVNLLYSLKKVARLMGLEWADYISPHSFRHGFISNQLDKGVNVAVVRDAVGHSSISTTNYYAHSQQSKIREMMLGD